MHFELLCSTHTVKRGKRYVAGDIVESDERLDEKFGLGKFKYLKDSKPKKQK